MKQSNNLSKNPKTATKGPEPLPHEKGESDICLIFKALSSPQRLKLFKMIYAAWQKMHRSHGRARCCCSLVKQFTLTAGKLDLSRSTVSHHFKELELAGLIHCERDGQAYRCTVNERALHSVRHFLA